MQTLLSILPFVLIVLMVLLAVLVYELLSPQQGIDMNHGLVNKDHQFGESALYYGTTVMCVDGKLRPALFTADQVLKALDRARRNPEDAPDIRTRWQKLIDA